MKPSLVLASLLLALPSPSVIFEWDRSPDPLVTGYRLYWGTTPNTYPFSQVASGNVTNITVADTKITANVPHFFVVVAMNAAGIESVPSNVVTWTNVVRPLPAGAMRVVVPPGGTATITISTGGQP